MTAAAHRAPPAALAFAELFRAPLETATLMASAPWLSLAPRGDGHDVVVMPGFAFGSRSTTLLRRYLSGLGYRVHDWGLGRNFGRRAVGDDGEHLEARIEDIAMAGGGKLSLVGHSLGGVMARAFAARRPDLVRMVISMGSPFVADPRGVNRSVLRAHDRMTGSDVENAPPEDVAPEVPFTAIFSRTDGIVSPSVCTERPATWAENIEVFASHIGLIAHPAVFWAVADRLAQPADDWAPFAPEGLQRLMFGQGHDLAA